MQGLDAALDGRLALDNPWWLDGTVPLGGRRLRPAPLPGLLALHADPGVRTVRLCGPRGAGRTTLLLQAAERLIADGHPPASIVYLSAAAPAYAGTGLAALLERVVGDRDLPRLRPIVLLLDDAEAMPEWPLQLCTAANRLPRLTCIAALAVGAMPRQPVQTLLSGDMADFHLPPVGFAEHIAAGRAGRRPLIAHDPAQNLIAVASMDALNAAFLDWIAAGGQPSPDAGGLLGGAPLERVLWPAIPPEFGIAGAADLFRVFTILALNAGAEISLESVAAATGAAKNTIRKYLDYLEAAFLLTRVDKIDLDAGAFERARSFKVYLNDPSIRTLLAGPPEAGSPALPRLVENAVFAAWRGRNPRGKLYFARRRGRDIPFVSPPPEDDPAAGYGLYFVDWSDAPPAAADLRLPAHDAAPRVARVEVFTRAAVPAEAATDPRLAYTPAAVYCWDTSRWPG